MRHQFHPIIDGLEPKTLLSPLTTGLVTDHHVLQAEVQQPVTPQSSRTVSLTTNQTTYNPGQVVQMSLTLTNTSNHNEPVLLGPSMDGFFITQNDTVIWRSNEGFEPQSIVIRILKPGQSITLTAQWTVPTSARGTFVVHNQMFPAGPVATFNVTTASTLPTPRS